MTTPTPDPLDETMPASADDTTDTGEPGTETEPDDGAVEEAPPRKTHLVLATLVGLVMAVVGAAGWVYVVTKTTRRYALIALVIGLLVGYAVRLVGRSGSRKAGLLAGFLALLSAVAGQFFERYGLLTKDTPLSFFDTFDILTFEQGFDLFKRDLNPLTYIMFALAAVTGYLLGIDPKARPKPAAEAPAEDLPEGETLDGETAEDEVPEGMTADGEPTSAAGTATSGTTGEPYSYESSRSKDA